MSDAQRKIVTENVYPPIPIRRFDWCAYYDGDEESGPRGWGETEQKAIADLRINNEEDCGVCHHAPGVSCSIGGCPHGRDL